MAAKMGCLGPIRQQAWRVWKGNKIIIGRNDGSVSVEKLSPDGTIDWRRMCNSGYGNKSWIDSLSPEQIAKLSYWDIEEK